MTAASHVTRRFNVQIGEGWKTTSVVFIEQSPLALVRLTHEQGGRVSSRFDMGKGIYIDALAAGEHQVADREQAQQRTRKYIAAARNRALADGVA